ncbi:MAG: hypothetical protein ACK58T_16180, partial [Phycisphaerae bacterium]
SLSSVLSSSAFLDGEFVPRLPELFDLVCPGLSSVSASSLRPVPESTTAKGLSEESSAGCSSSVTTANGSVSLEPFLD